MEVKKNEIIEVQNKLMDTSIIINSVMTKKSESKITMMMMMIGGKIK